MSRLKPSNRLLVAGGGVVPAALRVVPGADVRPGCGGTRRWSTGPGSDGQLADGRCATLRAPERNLVETMDDVD